jgi:hypothetical protein
VLFAVRVFLGSECDRAAAENDGVGGTAFEWMKVFCTQQPIFSSMPGVIMHLSEREFSLWKLWESASASETPLGACL